jgi:hypothetical protein
LCASRRNVNSGDVSTLRLAFITERTAGLDGDGAGGIWGVMTSVSPTETTGGQFARRVALGPEAARIDSEMASRGLSPDVRVEIWSSARAILAHGPTSSTGSARATGIAIGYVQSGKTTSFTALMSLAADAGYRVVVAMLGSTNLLLEQNRDRLTSALGLGARHDYRWVHFENPDVASLSPGEFGHYLSRGRLVLVTLLKHRGRIDDARQVFSGQAIGGVPTLFVDDEADQVSLNTRVREGDQSPTYAALGRLREGLGPHLYVQYTATPYAPLLLEVGDFLAPDFVELLRPGPGYVGGREFFVDHRATVVREITDAPGPSESPPRLPDSLVAALAEFVVGAALLVGSDPTAAPVSMLIHPSGRVGPQRRYEYLVGRCLEAWRTAISNSLAADVDFAAIRDRMTAAGCARVGDAAFASAWNYVLDEATLWRVNSDEDAQRTVRWNVAPVHILIGGNKLDRGFTVEGLTVSWLGRPPSQQLDTMVQRARAYGYRARYLPYCRIYASDTTIAALTAGVETELDMRARLREWVNEGRPVKDWAADVGLVLAPGLNPTRADVVRKVVEFHGGWHFLSLPSDADEATHNNFRLIEELGLTSAPLASYGRLRHPTLSSVDASEVLRVFIDDWALDYSPGWDRAGLRSWLRRVSAAGRQMPVVMLTGEQGKPRERAFDEHLGFDQLMQGRDPRPGPNSYPGDREILPGRSHVQVHLVCPKTGGDARLALAILVQEPHRVVRRESTGS